MIAKENINSFVAQNNPRAITQTGYWLEIEKANGHQAYIIYTLDKNRIKTSALLIKHQLPLKKNYLYCPYGPIVDKTLDAEATKQAISELIREIHRCIDLSNTIFIRFEPFYQDCHVIYPALLEQGFHPTNQFTQPKDTLILNLVPGIDKVFSQFKQKTRYNIRLADKKDIRIVKTNDISQVKLFYDLLQKTCDRNQFRPHSLRHYENIIRILGPDDIACLYLAHYKNKVIAGTIVTYFGKVATYLHGASSNTYRNLMSTYSLQWQAIQEATERQCRYYDFGGIAPPNSPANHPWQGITRFKTGFGGMPITTIGHMEKTINHPWNFAYQLAKKIQF